MEFIVLCQWWWSVCEIARVCPSKHSNLEASNASAALYLYQCSKQHLFKIVQQTILFYLNFICAFIVIWNALDDLYGMYSKRSWFFSWMFWSFFKNEKLCALDLWIEESLRNGVMTLCIGCHPIIRLGYFNRPFTCRSTTHNTHAKVQT